MHYSWRPEEIPWDWSYSYGTRTEVLLLISRLSNLMSAFYRVEIRASRNKGHHLSDTQPHSLHWPWAYMLFLFKGLCTGEPPHCIKGQQHREMIAAPPTSKDDTAFLPYSARLTDIVKSSLDGVNSLAVALSSSSFHPYCRLSCFPYSRLYFKWSQITLKTAVLRGKQHYFNENVK